MRQVLKSLATGIVSGILSYQIAVFALARTSAFTLPSGASQAIWVPLVVFGLGVTLVAAVIHLAALAITKSPRVSALFGFGVAFAASLAFAGLLATGIPALTAAVIGASLATLVANLRSNNSFKPTPLRGAS